MCVVVVTVEFSVCVVVTVEFSVCGGSDSGI